MRRVVLDPGVFVSALITPAGPPAKLVERLHGAEFELVISPQLLAELEDVLLRAKFRRYVGIEEAQDFLAAVRRDAAVAPDPSEPPFHSVDPKDDYLIALAYAQKAILVSGDSDLLDLTGGAPICAPADLLGDPVP
ncbi:MAG TPA: putative toxin-antitoxin system toxin component, PIN family [Solirubrobacterales bacterium]|jgi:putative PIN family toxin of toxin-antitoxin system|nr:putative toxin-antitoxin system toxin component, PIN family [Solirubrobacterales bacterium]